MSVFFGRGVMWDLCLGVRHDVGVVGGKGKRISASVLENPANTNVHHLRNTMVDTVLR